MNNLIIVLLFCLLCGCVSTTNPNELKDSRIKILFTSKPPEFNKFKEIYNKPYKIHKYDCSNKSAEYVSHLMGKGIFAQIVSVDYDGPNMTKLIYHPDKGYVIETHAVVRAFWRNKFVYCDPTNFTWSDNIKDYAPAGLSGITRITEFEDFVKNPEAYSF